MFKLKNQFKIISFYLLFIFAELLFIDNNKKLYALERNLIALEEIKIQLEEELNILMIQFNNTFNNTNLNPQIHSARMSEISDRMHLVQNNILSIDEQILARNQRNLQIRNNQN